MAPSFRAAVACAALLLSTAAGALQEIYFGVVPDRPDNRSLWEAFTAQMARDTGLRVVPFFAASLPELVEAQRQRRVQVAAYDNFSAVSAVDRANGEVFAQFSDVYGSAGYRSYIITHRDSPLNTLEDMFRHGKSLTYGTGEFESTSGRLAPRYYVFMHHGMKADDAFKAVRPNTHALNLLAVLGKEVDVATSNSEQLDRLMRMDPARRAEVKVLWTSPLIVRESVVWRRDLPEDAKARVRRFVLAYGKQPQHREFLNGIGSQGFLPSNDAQLVPVRQLEFVRDRAKVEGDGTISAGEKSSRLRAIDARLAELARQAASQQARGIIEPRNNPTTDNTKGRVP